MVTWPTTLPAPQKNIGIVPGDTRIERRLQSGRTEFRRFGDGKPDAIKALFRFTWAEWDIFKEFHAHELNLGINWFSADWIDSLGYNTHRARILGYPREVALQNYYVDVLCNLIIQTTSLIVTEDSEWPCEQSGSEPEEPVPGESGYGYIFGGYIAPDSIRDCDRYTAETNVWTNKADIPLPARSDLKASTIGTSLYAYGGSNGGTLSDCDGYTPDVWVSKTNMLAGKSNHSASTIGSAGYVYCGWGSANVRCDEYTPTTDTWANKTDLPSPARVHSAASTINNKSYVYCGQTYAGHGMQDCDEYDPNLNTWASKTDTPLPARYDLAASTIGSAGYIYGGYSGGNHCDEYLAIGDVWASKTDISISVSSHAASTIGSAGYVYDSNQHCLRFIPNTWTTMANFPSPNRHSHAASTL